jgi:hypothetical protein
MQDMWPFRDKSNNRISCPIETKHEIPLCTFDKRPWELSLHKGCIRNTGPHDIASYDQDSYCVYQINRDHSDISCK